MSACPPLEFDLVVLTPVLGQFEPSLHKRSLNHFTVVSTEVSPRIRQPLRHQHPPFHGSAARRIFDVIRATSSDPDIVFSLHTGTVSSAHVRLNEVPNVVVNRRDAVGQLAAVNTGTMPKEV